MVHLSCDVKMYCFVCVFIFKAFQFHRFIYFIYTSVCLHVYMCINYMCAQWVQRSGKGIGSLELEV